MKKITVFLVLFCTISLVQNANAQSLGSLKKAATTTISNDKIATYKALLEKPEIQTKVKEQLINNESLRESTMNYLNTDSSTKGTVQKITEKAASLSGNGLGSLSKSSLMSTLLSNPELATKAMSFVKSNPEILTKVMSLVGM